MTLKEFVDILQGRKMVEYMGNIYEVVGEHVGGVILQDVNCVDYSTKVWVDELYLHGSVYERR